MLTTNQLRQIAARTGARDIANVEIDVILTHILQLFSSVGLMDHLAFKGGTMLRKIVFGSTGRLSTDLDFTRHSDIDTEDLMLELLIALDNSYEGITFQFAKDGDWYHNDDGCSANPVCTHADNERGIKIKIQISTRERPILLVQHQPQLHQEYFSLLSFQPARIPCLAYEEAVAEKIRAASQRSKIRDLYDLSEVATRPLARELVRSLAILKLWNSGGPSLDIARLQRRIEGARGYDIGDLRSLLRRDQEPDLRRMVQRTIEGFRFLENLTELERRLSLDQATRLRGEADRLIAEITRPPPAAADPPDAISIAPKPKKAKAGQKKQEQHAPPKRRSKAQRLAPPT